MGRLEGRAAIVVGGGQSAGETIGNGRAVAVAFAREGAHVLVVDRDPDAAAATVEQIAAGGGTAVAHQADVSDAAACVGISAAAIDAFGHIDILHNNVAQVIASPTEQTGLEDWERAFSVNLTSTWLVCRHVLPHMKEQGRGVILNVSSLAAMMTGANPYSLTKKAVNALTQGLALEYAPHGIRVNAIVPGMIDTPMGVDRVAAATGQDRVAVAAGRAALVPMGRQGSAWDVAHSAVFLASDAAAYITGAILPVDGGAALRGSFP